MTNAYVDQLKETLMAYPVSAAISCIIGGAVLRELVRLCRRQPTRPEDACGATSNVEHSLPAAAGTPTENRLDSVSHDQDQSRPS